MKTYQEYENAEDKQTFILTAVKDYIVSDMYKCAYIAQQYYATDNEAIRSHMGYLERRFAGKLNVKFHKIRNSFFPKAVKKISMYLLGNGVPIDDKLKKLIDKKFDRRIIEAVLNACVDGVVWGFPDVGKLRVFRATEFVPLFDERTSELRAGIRFWQVAKDKPVNIELYSEDGIIDYKATYTLKNIELVNDIRAYKHEVFKDAVTETVVGSSNYGTIPIYPIYANELRTSELTPALRALIDAWDFTMSELVDGVTMIDGIQRVIKGFGGQDVEQLVMELQAIKAILVDSEADGVDNDVVETPYNAKKEAIAILERHMYVSFMLPDMSNTGQAVTATEINTTRSDMDIKVDMLEWQVADFIENVLALYGNNETLTDFVRSSVANQQLAVSNIKTQLDGGWIDIELAIKLDPTIPEGDKDALILRMAQKAKDAKEKELKLQGTVVVSDTSDTSDEAVDETVVTDVVTDS